MPENQLPGFKPGTPLSSGEARKLAAEMTTQIMCAGLSGADAKAGLTSVEGPAHLAQAFRTLHGAIMACLALPLDQS